jgi:hypothetical protein
MNTYDKREVDSHLRVLYEKETLSQSSPAKFVIDRIEIHEPGSGYAVNDTVYVTNGDAYNERFSIKVTGVGGNGEIASIWFNDTIYHDYNFDTINPGTTE